MKGKGRSNTVNICDANNRRGEYDWVIRFIEPTRFIPGSENPPAKFQTVPDFVNWLKEQGGRVEQVPPSESPDIPAPNS